MKLRSLGILMVSLLLLVALTSTLLLQYVSGQFDSGMQSAQFTYNKAILPLRQIDANTKNLRFHLYAAFMHNPEQSVSPLHTHPTAAHTDTIRAEMAKNAALWQQVAEAAQARPEAELGGLKGLYDSYFNKGVAPSISAAEASDWTGIVRSVTASLPEYIDFEKQLQLKIDTLQKLENDKFASERTRQRVLISTLVILTIVVLLGAALLVWYSVRGYTQRLASAVQATDAMAKGDLSQQLQPAGSCEASVMLHSLVRMQTAIRTMVGTIRSSSDSIHAAAAEVANGNADLSSRSEQQAASLEETASSMEQLTATVTQNADHARQATALAESASGVARKGGEVVTQVVDTMASINSAAREIVDIISVIDGIAFQTNILALNAAVEAARAGDQGRGFAVVASEVRNLAQRAASAAKDIKTLIGNSVAQIEGGTALAQQAGSTMNDIMASVQRVNSIIAEIASASQEQTVGISQINQSVIQMDDVLQQNVALVEEVSAAALSLQGQADTLTATVSVFTLQGSAPSASAGRSLALRAISA